MKSLYTKSMRFLGPRGGVRGVMRIAVSYARAHGWKSTIRHAGGMLVRAMFSRYLRSTVDAQVAASFSALVSGADERLEILNRMPGDLRRMLHTSYRAPLVKLHPEYASAMDVPRPAKTLVKAIAFYMPVPEPGTGPGFVAVDGWSRVAHQAPRFVGHYQPHLPAKPFDVDAPTAESMSREAALARQYGIHAFCFHQLMDVGGELPAGLLTILGAPDIDMHFAACLTTRAALRNASASASAEEGTALQGGLSAARAASLAPGLVQAMHDPRWLRVSGKPMLVILAERSAAASRESVAALRSALADAGVANVHLVGAPLISARDADYFDAVLEYAPTDSAAQTPAQASVVLAPDFTGAVFDYAAAAAASVESPKAARTVYRSAFPNWDTTGYGGREAEVFANFSPRLFAGWLWNLCVDASARLPLDDRFVFLNSWNGWESGSHLLPDLYLGHAHLEATRRTLEAFGPPKPKTWKADGKDVAAIVHLHYPDLWPEIAGYLRNLPPESGVYVSIAQSAPADLEAQIKRDFANAVVRRLENRGRDILPFMTLFREVVSDGQRYLCKIHSKKSKHRVDGDVWRRDLYDKLLGSPEVIDSILYAFEDRQTLGLIGPTGHMVSSAYYWGSNAANVGRLGRQLGFDAESMQYEFAAGTMFWAKVAALKPLLDLPLSRDDFEAEAGQLDGTLAHAVERALPLSVANAGMCVVDTNLVMEQGSTMQDVGDYGEYAWARRG
ncbi:glycoside hydrolase family 99-like domain-containing protein [Caballeronia sp. INML2]|uniref:glycoside hydrolase family 99-like domain-containing protein n=1 Tax=Caballeronia sp. INML2 TaxID=2921748 RepID=UPI0020296678|nr:glycoside hydrolase family 99-like domain-containing protein [Caballeronia sp. INML2]